MIKAGLSVDVDDALWSFFGRSYPVAANRYKCEIRQEIKNVIDLFATFNVKATFFIPGYILEEFPDMMDLFNNTEHEIGCHGYEHDFLTEFSAQEFEEDIDRAMSLLKKYCARPIVGYRAPGLTLAPVAKWAVPILSKYNFKYSSSLPALPAWQHKFLSISKRPFYWDNGLLEVPLSSYHNIPVCGSFYSRMIPHGITQCLTKKFVQEADYPLFYFFHPFEAFPGNNKEALRFHPLLSKLYFMNCTNYMKKLKWVLSELEFDTYSNILNEFKLYKS